jgi:Oligosaccharyltransferase subunit Ribophorin II
MPRPLLAQNFPTDTAHLGAAVAFHVGLFAILALFLEFWVFVPILTMLPILAMMGLLTAGAGYLNLSYLADNRLAAEKAAAAPRAQ